MTNRYSIENAMGAMINIAARHGLTPVKVEDPLGGEWQDISQMNERDKIKEITAADEALVAFHDEATGKRPKALLIFDAQPHEFIADHADTPTMTAFADEYMSDKFIQAQ